AQSANNRRALCFPERLSSALATHVSSDRCGHLQADRVLYPETAADGQHAMEHAVAARRRVRPVYVHVQVAVHGLGIPTATGPLRPLPDVPRRFRTRDRAMAGGIHAVPQEADVETWTSGCPEVATPHLPDQAAVADVPRGQVRAYPP